jgi:hypothetical protein
MNEDRTELELIKGNFKAEDAKDLLHKLIDYKINYHRVKSLEHELRFGTKDAHAKTRIKQLKSSKGKLEALINKALKENLDFELDATINIKLK